VGDWSSVANLEHPDTGGKKALDEPPERGSITPACDEDTERDPRKSRRLHGITVAAEAIRPRRDRAPGPRITSFTAEPGLAGDPRFPTLPGRVRFLLAPRPSP